MKRHELWRNEYRRNRYLEHANESELTQRFRDVFSNMMVLTNAGKIGLNELDEGGVYWMVVWTHLLEEYSLRGTGLPVGVIDRDEIPKPTFPDRPIQADAFHHFQQELRGIPFLIKFGDSRWLKETFEEGCWRISAASYYSDPSLNPARRDSELEITRHSNASEYKLEVFDANNRFKGIVRPQSGYMSWKYSMTTDYYVGCLSAIFSARLFDDFEADSCIVITNPTEFRTRLFGAAGEKLRDFHCGLEPVRYIDPYNCPMEDIRVPTTKHFRYWYQHEWRFVWVPSRAQKKLEPHVILSIGSMEDIALLVTR